MKDKTAIADKTAVGLSFVCAIHCLAMPILVTVLPALSGLPFADESFHFWMILAVIPISVYALSLGCKKHKRYRFLIIGFVGLTFMGSAVILGHDYLGEMGEKTLTVIGVVIVAIGHMLNFRSCQHEDNCSHSK